MISKTCTGENCTSTLIFKAKNRDHGVLCLDCYRKWQREKGVITVIGNGRIDYSSKSSKNSSSSEKSIPELVEAAQLVFNRWIRRRDCHDGYGYCISNGDLFPIKEMDAGHFWPTSTSSALRFHEDNVHSESVMANRFDANHLAGYRVHLILKIGLKRFKWLEDHRHDEKKWERGELLDIIKKYK